MNYLNRERADRQLEAAAAFRAAQAKDDDYRRWRRSLDRIL